MKNENGFAPVVEEIARVLEGKEVTREEIEAELKTYVESYHVDPWIAKRSIVKKYGGDVTLLGGGELVKLNDLVPGRGVNFIARVVSANERELGDDNGGKRMIYGIFGDETATVPFTLWEGEFPYEKGDVVKVRNGYTREWQGRIQISMGERSIIERGGEDDVPRVFTREAVEAKIGDLKDGMRNISTVFRVMEIETREVTVGDSTKTVYSGIAGDDTGMVRLSAWHDFGLVEGGVYKLQGAYVRAWRGSPQLTFDENSTCEKLADDALSPPQDIKNGRTMSLSELIEHGGAVGVRARGILIDIKKGSGLVSRCPECNRVTNKNMCMIHGKVQGNHDLRIKGILDDGTGAVTVILGKDLTEKLSGRTMEDYMQDAKEGMSNEVVRDHLIGTLLARPIEVFGNSAKDDFGVMLIAEDASLPALDLVREAREMLQAAEGGE